MQHYGWHGSICSNERIILKRILERWNMSECSEFDGLSMLSDDRVLWWIVNFITACKPTRLLSRFHRRQKIPKIAVFLTWTVSCRGWVLCTFSSYSGSPRLDPYAESLLCLLHVFTPCNVECVFKQTLLL